MMTILPVPHGFPVFPLLACYMAESGASCIVEQVGTCFAISRTGRMITAYHIIEKSPLQIAPRVVDMSFTFDRFYIMAGQKCELAFPVSQSYDCGNDVGVLDVNLMLKDISYEISDPFEIQPKQESEKIFSHVWWFGFSKRSSAALTPDDICLEIAKCHVEIFPQAGCGWIGSFHENKTSFLRSDEIPCYELDRPITPGMSGGPLCLCGTKRVVGVLKKNVSWEVDAYRADGSGVDKVRAGFGLAADLGGFIFQ